MGNEKTKSTFWSNLRSGLFSWETPKSQYEQQKTKMDLITKHFEKGPIVKLLDLPFTYQSCKTLAKESLRKCVNDFLKGMEKYETEFTKYAKEFREGMERFREAGDKYFEVPKDRKKTVQLEQTQKYPKAMEMHRVAMKKYEADYSATEGLIGEMESLFSEQVTNKIENPTKKYGDVHDRAQKKESIEEKYYDCTDSPQSTLKDDRQMNKVNYYRFNYNDSNHSNPTKKYGNVHDRALEMYTKVNQPNKINSQQKKESIEEKYYDCTDSPQSTLKDDRQMNTVNYYRFNCNINDSNHSRQDDQTSNQNDQELKKQNLLKKKIKTKTASNFQCQQYLAN